MSWKSVQKVKKYYTRIEYNKMHRHIEYNTMQYMCVFMKECQLNIT